MTDEFRGGENTGEARRTTLISRRSVMGAGAVVLGGAALAACASGKEEAGPPEPRVSKHEAGYQSKPHEGQRCGKCENFLPPIDCKRVRGVVQPWAWCHLFEAKA